MSNWRNTAEYRKWKEACKERDGNKCVLTGSTRRLEVHHKNHASYFQDQRFLVKNGVTIHRFVHLFFHWFYMKSTRHKCTEADWKRFVRFWRYLGLINRLGKAKTALGLLKEARDILLMCTLIDKSSQSKDMVEKIDQFLK